jgi:hypothetical protein
MSDWTPLSHEWVDRLAKCYDNKRYPEKDYEEFMMAVQRSTSDSLSNWLERAFRWKGGGRFLHIWNNRRSEVTDDCWRRMKESTDIPKLFPQRIVYNVFLLHLASDGRRPMIDQHSWRAFCDKGPPRISVGSNPEISGKPWATGAKFYLEYEKWFRWQVDQGHDKRQLDKALMAYGKSLKGSSPHTC